MSAAMEAPGSVRGRPDASVAHYAAAVRAALADLPAAQRDDLLDDLDDHLAEVAADEGGRLNERLGPPERYAAELRASLGLGPSVRRGRVAEYSRALRSQVTAWRTSRAGRELAQAAESLRPAAWVARGWLLTVTVAAYTGWELRQVPGLLVPRISGSRLLGLLVLVAAVLGSVALGRRGPGLSQRARTAVVLSTLLLLAFSVDVMNRISEPLDSLSYRRMSTVSGTDGVVRTEDGLAALVDGDRQALRNIEVRDAAGRPLAGPLFLYDQAGRPIENFLHQWWQPESPEFPQGRQLTLVPQRDAAGTERGNGVPLVYQYYSGETGTLEPTATPRPAPVRSPAVAPTARATLPSATSEQPSAPAARPTPRPSPS